MQNEQFVTSFIDFATAKKVDRPTAIRILDDVLRAMISKKFGTADHVDIVINPQKGDLQILRSREIVPDNSEDIWDPDKISLSEAQKIEVDFGVGEEVTEEVKLADFDRRTIVLAKQTLLQRVKDLDREALYQKYKQLVGQLITTEVYQILRQEVIVRDEDKNELSLPYAEQIPGEIFQKGQQVRAIISRVDLTKSSIKIILSRASNLFLEKLMEAEIPEIMEGLVVIKNVVRRPGRRAKVVVHARDDRIDPVAACVGMKGARIHSIINSIYSGQEANKRREQIDIIHYTDNQALYISRILSPAKIHHMQQQGDRMILHLAPDQIAMAVGTSGQNIHLASQLIGMPIDIHREEEESHEAQHTFQALEDAVAPEVIQKLQEAGLDTAASVLALSKAALVQRTQLETSVIDHLYNILSQVTEANQSLEKSS